MVELELMHYGTPRHSGRYAWGSGDNPYQHEPYFRKSVSEMKSQGMTDKQIMAAMDMSTTEYRAMVSISKAQKRNEDRARALELKDKGYSNVQIGKMFDPPINESTVRALLNPTLNERNNLSQQTADFLKDQLETKRYLDIGDGSERELSEIIGNQVSTERLNTAAKMLEMEGYQVYNIRVEQVTNKGKFTTMKVLAPPGTEYKDIYQNIDQIKSIGDYDNFDEATKLGIKPPANLDSSRIMIRYGDDGGSDKDGVIELRRGVEDISLGESSYAQVRIAVDGKHYLKGMAVYSDGSDMPDGVDVIFNTNKATGTPKEKVFKDLKEDPDNPFGATIKIGGQSTYIDSDGTEKLRVINKVNEEGDWGEYSKTLSSQFLSKQNVPLARKQLDLSYSEKLDEYESICSLTNSAVKKKLLESFADDCDASAVHLKAASLPRQAFQVILPITSLKDTEIFAPNYKDGEEVVLVRYPHGGTFEIPRLKVNNKNAEGKDILGQNAKDAVGINAKVAEQLSGADFDGDTVLVIPVSGKVNVKNSKPLEGLKDFNPKEKYPYYEGMKVISSQRKQTEMGIVSNLITDMTLKGATEDELARAVRHSMVVIDAEKHKLNYQQSYIDNDIAGLKAKYQDGGGASTLISRAKSTTRVNERKIFNIDRDTDPETGEKIFKETGRTYNKNGKIVTAQQEVTKMANTKDARTLISTMDTQMENVYADYANKCKGLANEARKAYLATPNTKYSPTAKEQYAYEVSSLDAKLNRALKNAPKERQAQLVASQVVKTKRGDNPDMTKGEEKKLRQQALSAARARLGASKRDVQVDISDKEWEAIQSGAISNNKLMKILDNADLDKVKERATPRATTKLSPGKESRIKNMLASGYTNAEIAEAVGVSATTVARYA